MKFLTLVLLGFLAVGFVLSQTSSGSSEAGDDDNDDDVAKRAAITNERGGKQGK
jgi:hypothetical protein